MINIQKKDNYTLVTLKSFDALETELSSLNTDHLVIEVSENLNIDTSKISLFLDIAKSLKQNRMSFVIIKPGIHIDDFPENLNVLRLGQRLQFLALV